tara:strand:- start:1312 stop:1530 length:219 start_codon:yes stop_codon:yes gene_type:complete
MSKTLLKTNYGAITQPFGMEYRQTKINAVESGGKISEELEPSTLKVKSLDTAINDRYLAKAKIAISIAGEVL